MDQMMEMCERGGRKEGLEPMSSRPKPRPSTCSKKETIIVVKAEITGMDKDHLEVNPSDHRLTIKGEKEARRRDQRREPLSLRTERWIVYPAIELPKDVHADQVKASFKDGVLEVRMPKTEAAKARSR